MTLNPKNKYFLMTFWQFLAEKSELQRNGWRQTKIIHKQEEL